MSSGTPFKIHTSFESGGVKVFASTDVEAKSPQETILAVASAVGKGVDWGKLRIEANLLLGLDSRSSS